MCLQLKKCKQNFGRGLLLVRLLPNAAIIATFSEAKLPNAHAGQGDNKGLSGQSDIRTRRQFFCDAMTRLFPPSLGAGDPVADA